jgi:hypothetical protein
VDSYFHISTGGFDNGRNSLVTMVALCYFIIARFHRLPAPVIPFGVTAGPLPQILLTRQRSNRCRASMRQLSRDSGCKDQRRLVRNVQVREQWKRASRFGVGGISQLLKILLSCVLLFLSIPTHDCPGQFQKCSDAFQLLWARYCLAEQD